METSIPPIFTEINLKQPLLHAYKLRYNCSREYERGESIMLTEMLNASNSLDTYTVPQKTILMTLATTLQNNTNLLFLDPDELVEQTGKGTKDSWETLLRMQETQNFIKAQMQFLSSIAQRKTFRSLVELALSGNAQAAKQVQELSGIMNQQDQNRTVVLHHIPRPKEVQNGTQDNT